jgi:hypothetical protein
LSCLWQPSLVLQLPLMVWSGLADVGLIPRHVGSLGAIFT